MSYIYSRDLSVLLRAFLWENAHYKGESSAEAPAFSSGAEFWRSSPPIPLFHRTWQSPWQGRGTDQGRTVKF